jgi:SAM-dependent methyltransferase
MDQVRKPYTGVWNIVRFNRHLYIIALVVIAVLFSASILHSGTKPYTITGALLIVFTLSISLLISYYIYDRSGLYSLRYMDTFCKQGTIVNIHSGFDETSALIEARYQPTQLIVLDFYDPQKHTEVSIRRAREAYNSYPGTQQVRTSAIPLPDHSADTMILFLAAHEIRNDAERAVFFGELARILKPSGHIIVTEHLRDMPNFIAYTIGFFHFHSRAAWLKTFNTSGLNVCAEISNTPFISTFILTHNGTAS